MATGFPLEVPDDGHDIYDLDMTPEKKRARAIIINEVDFADHLKLDPRSGSDRDAADLLKLFRTMGFATDLYKNLTTDEMNTAIHSLVLDVDVLAIALLTHGGCNDTVYGKDREILWDDLIRPILQCPTLAGKPKFFIKQACRGSNVDPGILVKPRADDDSQLEYTLPTRSDCLTFHATCPGDVAFRKHEGRSLFIQVFCETMTRWYEKLDVVTICTLVNRKVAHSYATPAPTETGIHSKAKQMSQIDSTLTKQLCFNNNLIAQQRAAWLLLRNN